MKPQRVFIALILTIGLLITNVMPAFAMPPLPSSFYGTVKIGGANVPPGSTVKAKINGVEYASTTAIVFGSDTVYSLDVPGDDPSTVGIEGGVAGDTVAFYVNDQAANQTAPWLSGSNTVLNLTVTVLPTCYALTLSHTGQGTNPVGSPANSTGCAAGQYVSGATIGLSGAVPTSGWQIASWTGTDNDASTASTNTVTMPASIRTASVNYTALPNHTVTFNANGGTGTMSNQVANVPTALTLNSFTRAGFSFNGWNTQSGGGGTSYANGASYPFTADITLYAQWTALPNHTVTFNANGGTGTMSNQVANVPTALTLNSFTRAGFSFNGWNTQSGGGGTSYANGASYPFTADITLYAQWTALPNHTVTFNANGGTGSMSNQVANVPTPLTLNSFTRAGFSFNGWNTQSGGGGTPYANGASYPFAADVTLFAQWTALPNHTVTFDANGGTGSMSNQVANVPTALTLNSFTRAGFSFNGWNTQSGGGGTPYANGASYPFAADATLFAQWTALPNHTVTFDANLGTGTMSNQVANVPTALTLNSFTRAGYTFSGWNTQSGGGGTPYANGASYPFAADVTLFAQWTALPNHTVTFDANLGTGTMSNQVANVPTALTLNTFTRAGYSFNGWNTQSGGGGTPYANGASYPFAADVTLFAQWTALPNHTVTFDANLGTGTMSNQIANVPTALTLNSFTRAGYSFSGWNTNAGGTGTAYANGATYPFTADATLFAQWTALPPTCYALTLSHTGQGTNPVGSPANSTGCAAGQYVSGATIGLSGAVPTSGWQIASWTGTDNDASTASTNTVTMPASIRTASVNYTALPNHTVTFNANLGTGTMSNQVANVPTALTLNSFTRAGFSFNGWNTQSGGGGTSYANGASYPFTADITLYAQWTALPNHTVTFNANGGTGSMSNQVANVPTALTLNSFTRAGFLFNGWNTQSGGGGTPYANGASYPFAADATLFAQWTALPNHTVTFDANLGTGTMSNQVANVPTALTLNSFTRAGYTFSGWNTQSGGGGTPYANGASYPFAADVTLFAQWTALPNHTVTFDANLGTGTMSNQVANVPTALTLNTFTRAGYSFNGWNTQSGGGGTPYANGASYPFAADVTLFAQWTALPNHTVTFDANLGTGTMSNQIANVPTALTLNSFTRAGYSFSGWNTNAGGTGTAYANGATYPFTADATLFAQWTALPPTCYALTLSHTGQGTNPVGSPANSTGCAAGQYVSGATIGLSGAVPTSGWQIASWTGTDNDASTASTNTVTMPASIRTASVNYTALPNHTVTFNANLGTGTMSNQVANVPTALTLNSFTRAGFSFNGWNTQSGGGGTPYANGASYPFAADVTLFAQWTALPNHTVTFDANGGTGSMSNQVANVPTALTLNTFTRAGYTFSGWNTQSGGGGTPYANGATYSFAADITLYAQWTANTYTVTFNASGGSTPNPTSKVVTFGSAYGALATTSRTGYTLAGWFTAASGGTQVTSATIVSTASNHTLYAQWTALPNHTVTFDANGGTGTMSNQIANVPTPLTLNTFTRAGYSFSGWNTAAGGTGTAYANGATYPFAADVTLFAQWTALPPTCYVLTLSHTGQGTNPVGSPANSTGCAAGQYVSGASISLSGAVPTSGWQISSWTGTNNNSSTASTNTVTMPASARTASVNYSQNAYTLTVTSLHGTVVKNPNKALYYYGEVVQLTATPAAGWKFSNWTGDATGTTNPVSVTMNGNQAVTANYTQIGYTLTVTSLHGTVAKNPNKALYSYGEVVKLTATPAAGWKFANWTGGATGTANPVSVRMTSNKSVTANYSSTVKTLTLRSVAAYDGWVLESSENSNVGKTLNAGATTFNLGDDAAKRQFRTILSFNTALPSNAVITSATLKIMKQGQTGANPFLSLGNIAVDIRNGAFGNNAALQSTDFQALASKNMGLTLTNTPVQGWYSSRLSSANFGYINKAGVTQFRLRFMKDDNNNLVADYLRFYSGNSTTASYRPILVITYYVP